MAYDTGIAFFLLKFKNVVFTFHGTMESAQIMSKNKRRNVWRKSP